MVRGQMTLRFPILLGAALITATAISGCSFPSYPNVTVTVKSADGEEADAEAGDEGGGDDASAAETVAGYGNLTGRILFDGTPPALPPEIAKGDPNVKDPEVCGAEAVPNETLEIDRDTMGIQNAVVYLAKAPKHIKPELANAELEPAVFDQKGCKFFPHVVPVRVDVGQKLVVKSDDPIAHNTHTYPNRNTPFNGAIKANDREGVEINYSRAENEPIRVVCDLHSWMKAYHFPIDHPYYAVTGPDGSFTIEGLPAGQYDLKIWQERAGLLERKLTVTIDPDGTTTIDPDKTTYGADKFNL